MSDPAAATTPADLECDVAVIGAGTAGLAAERAARRQGARTLLIDDTDLVHKSGDSRAMPLDDFIAETLDKLATAETEVLVDRVVPLRANPGPQEHALINQFNLSLVENPIPVA